MPGDPRYPLLGNGQNYIAPLQRPGSPSKLRFPRSYAEARDSLLGDLVSVRKRIESIPSSHRLDEIVVCFRLLPQFLAKSYHPGSLLRGPLVDIGSRRWYSSFGSKDPTPLKNRKLAKLVFVRTTVPGLDRFESTLHRPERAVPKSWREDVQKLEKITLLDEDECILGFVNDWVSGRSEIVLHPFPTANSEAENLALQLIESHNVNPGKVTVRHNRFGSTFISAVLNRPALSSLAKFNPIRSVRPLSLRALPIVRASSGVPGPIPPTEGFRSSALVGVLDGGSDASNPFLKNYVSTVDLTPQPPEPDFLGHGTAVAGAALYGRLNDYSQSEMLPQPRVGVVSFRVLPFENPADFDLYEIIDYMEDVIPKRTDIKVWNLSLGPAGPIEDDHLTRFTSSVDILTWDHKVLIGSAVGNDGKEDFPYSRVQAPSDSVNGLGIGAFTFDHSGNTIRAPYSCIGEGREGCKVKPDVVAFGGCDQRPIHLVSLTPGEKSLAAGTSFSCPTVMGKAAELLGRCEQLRPLDARALIIHSADHPDGTSDTQIGHGFFDKAVDDVLYGASDSVLVMFQGRMYPGNSASLPIPVPDVIYQARKVIIDWTIVTLTQVNPLHSEDYTVTCIEDYFYPNAEHFRFSHPNHKNTKTADVRKNPLRANELTSQGWKRSVLPKTLPPSTYKTEAERRQGLKWDTVVKRRVGRQGKALWKPFIVLQAINRHNNPVEEIEYSVVVSVKAPGLAIYDATLAQYQALQPVRIKAVNEILVPITS